MKAKKIDSNEKFVETEVVEGEVVTDVSEGGDPVGTRRLRVYAHDGDFIITIPNVSRVTFGYFNPAAPANIRQNHYQDNVARQTALRIYEDNTDKRQLACFLGVLGFRDLRISKTTLQRTVTISTNYEDDGQGTVQAQAKAHRALIAGTEEGDDLPF